MTKAKNPNNHPAWCNCKDCRMLYAPPGGWPEIEIPCSCTRLRYAHQYNPEKCAAHYYSFTELTDEEWQNMAKLPTPSSASQNNASRTRGLRFIKTDDMPQEPKTALILAAVLEPTDYSDMQVKIEFPEGSGEKWILGLKFNNDNYARCHEEFGDDTEHWQGRRVMLSRVRSEALEKDVPRVDPLATDEKTGDRKAEVDAAFKGKARK